MDGNTALVARQLWHLPTTTSSTSMPLCTPFSLPSAGVISLPDTTITLTTDAIFSPQCTGGTFANQNGNPSTIADLKDPFYASTTPQVYVIAAATVLAWILVVMLIIAPRTSFAGPSAAAPGFSQGHGIIGGANGGSISLIGVGSRPWLQKVAALTVAVSLTIATADTFEVAEQQYLTGYMDATAMRDQVLGSLEIRVTRVISDIFVWLAQVQTLIRLFARHKEKVMIKWIGFALIIFDSIFSCLNAFLVISTNQPRNFVDAIPALSYLFELALGLLYAAWVIYYALTKRRYAFYHSKMKSISMIALLSLVSVLTPVVFFVTDVSNTNVASWGDYFRWVGAAAASVVVWEWVERIEALERDEKKDGILGREIFDGEDLLDVSNSEEVVWTSGRRARPGTRRGGDEHALENGSYRLASRLKWNRPTTLTQSTEPLHPSHVTGAEDAPTDRHHRHNGNIAFGGLPVPDERRPQVTAADGITLPLPVASPISRTDTSSAGSTVYVVRYEPAAEVPHPVRRQGEPGVDPASTQRVAPAQQLRQTSANRPDIHAADAGDPGAHIPTADREQSKWYAMANPFKRKRISPPAEIQKARNNAVAAAAAEIPSTSSPSHNFSRWDVKNQFGVLAAGAGERLRETVGRSHGGSHRDDEQEDVLVVPAQPRGSGRTWSPASLGTDQSSSPRPQHSGSVPRHDSDDAGPPSVSADAVVSVPAPQWRRQGHAHAGPSSDGPEQDRGHEREP